MDLLPEGSVTAINKSPSRAYFRFCLSGTSILPFRIKHIHHKVQPARIYHEYIEPLTNTYLFNQPTPGPGVFTLSADYSLSRCPNFLSAWSNALDYARG